MNVALLGFGTVGRAVAELLGPRPAGLRLTHVLNRGVARKQAAWAGADEIRWTEDMDDVLSSDVGLVIEVIGGLEPAGTWITRAIEAGKSVVTANKQLIAQRGTALLALAARCRRELAFEASVAGGIPVIRALRDGLSADRLTRVSGILNGTSNYILTRMESDNLAFDAALREAQERGFAEADPTDDLEGFDARAKLCILGRVALRLDIAPAAIACRSIRPIADVDFVYARRLGRAIRQVSRIDRGDEEGPVVAFVQPALVALSSPLARVQGSQNLVLVRGRFGGDTAFSGQGAGGHPTAVAVVSDAIAIAERGPASAPAPPSDVHVPAVVSPSLASPYYLRFVVRDRPGIVAGIAQALSRRGINIDAVLQEPGEPKDALPFVVTLETCDPEALSLALDDIARFDFHVLPPVSMPMLES